MTHNPTTNHPRQVHNAPGAGPRLSLKDKRVRFHLVPAGSHAVMCKGSTCGRRFFWAHVNGSRLPIDVDVVGGAEPSATKGTGPQGDLLAPSLDAVDGRGVMHHVVCPDVDEFKRPRSR